MNSNAAAANTEYLKHVHATKNAAQTAQHQREVSELKQQQASGQRDDSESQDSDSRDSHNQHAPSQDLLPLQPEPKTDMEKDTTRLQEIAERTTQEAKETKVDGNALINAMSDLITVSADPAGTADALLTAIVTWEKRALAYLENKVATPRGYLAVFNFMAPAASTTQAIRNELKEILQQCIVLATCDGHLKEAVGLLNQHKYRLEDNHAKTDLSRELVYVQLETLTDIITNVARTRFDYPAKQILPPPATVTKSLS
jgi:ABC-type Zn2+ transport system substrate-binding protein/surface adhesin